MTDSRNDRSRLLLSEDATIGRTVAYCGVLTALAMIFSYVETLIPINFGVPGVKLGLANLVVLSGLYYLRPAQVLAISAARIVLTGFLFGNGVSILYSLAGGLLSFCVMLLLRKAGGFSPAGVSVAGGVSHNIGQLLVASFVISDLRIFSYLPVLMFSGIISGILIGFLAHYVLKSIRIVFKQEAIS